MTEFMHVDWSRHASIYQVNLRQYTPEGTFRAFEAHLPRIAEMGAGIVWFMPIQPIGQSHRKGGLGSYYSIREYTQVNSEFGTLEDFKRVVARAHELGLKVIIDWVANHTAWDHPWTIEHPDWYKKDEKGEIHSYVYRANAQSEPEYWTDVVGLDYSAPALWEAMTREMLFWMTETGIDGFRCDVAALVPLEFWEQLRPRLEAVRPVFMLAEAHEPILHRKAFDATYDWDLLDQFKAIAKGQGGVERLQAWWSRRLEHYQPSDYRLIYTANHDTNSWHGSCAELFGSEAALRAFSTLAALLPGQPLVYGGQEGYFRKRLAFFEKDPIDWADRPLQRHYTQLLQLHKHHPALANGDAAMRLTWHDAGNESVLAFERSVGERRLQVRVNLSESPQAYLGFDGMREELPAWGVRLESR